ncbi:MFS domain-containing histidine kinase [Paenibacillus sp. PL2-23]|uniref:MFS domain-containing histidine kinase n=1 Tax=Paenibacillus sp. PL2-23 TaxID=2100729 RepID=UPI0030F9BACF
MNRALVRFGIGIMLSMLLAVMLLRPQEASARSEGSPETLITEWQMMWVQPGEELTIEQVSALPDDAGWFPVQAGGEYPELPEGVKSAWLKVELPELTQMRPAFYTEDLFARDVVVYVDGQKVFDSQRSYEYERNQLVLPLERDESNSLVFIKLLSNTEGIGQKDDFIVGEYEYLHKKNVGSNVFDLVLGASLMLIAIFMAVSTLFLNRSLFPEWNSLSLSILTIGIMQTAYSSFVHINIPQIGFYVYHSFDVASSILLPSLFYFFEKIFGKGPKNIIQIFRKSQMYVAIVFLSLWLLGFFSESIHHYYQIFGPILFAITALGSLIGLVLFLILACLEKNESAIVLTCGFSIFVCITCGEIIWYFVSGRTYELMLWKFGVIVFVISLVVILVRKVTENYKQLMKYSKQLEVFNNELQRSEKIEMISQLAASVAHEVRNPLQVTRGFLQLIKERSNSDKDKAFMNLATEELDRASEIITDFLTFAKPGLENHVRLDLFEELHQIKAIVLPLVTMQGGRLTLTVQQNLLVQGNSSKLKQALINIVKNSVEALGENGQINIRAEKIDEDDKIVLCIEDNGEGMNDEDLTRLGEPYYSQKTKGTGLGLMVTFRIIEAMNGQIVYKSKKGIGTQAYITFPIKLENANTSSA